MNPHGLSLMNQVDTDMLIYVYIVTMETNLKKLMSAAADKQNDHIYISRGH